MKDETSDPILREALEWLVRMRDERVSEVDRRNFAIWLAQHESHPLAWSRAEALWSRFDIAKPEFERFRHKSISLSRRRILKGAVLAMAGGGGFYAMSRHDWFADHVTGIGERRTVTLPDKSTVELGSYSALSVDYRADERRTQLYRGEGFFDVTSSHLPFVVEAGNGSVQALGTQFDVKSVDDLVTVTVSERRVRVNVDGMSSLDIEKGQQVSYGRSGVGAINAVDPDTVITWRRDRIVFEDVPLRRVLTELQRYRQGRILLMDASLGEIPVTAVFDTRQANRALQTIAETLPIRVFQATDYIAFVYRAS